MTQLNPGNYSIVNRVTSYDGSPLAVTYNGNNSIVTVTEYRNLPTQVWSVYDTNNSLQCVSPVISSGLQIGMGDGVLLMLADWKYFYGWDIVETEGVYVVQDGSLSYFWGMQSANSGAPVFYGVGTGDEKQTWMFTPALED